MKKIQNNMTKQVFKLFIIIGVILGMSVGTLENVTAKEKIYYMGYYYVAENQPCKFQEPTKGKIQIISSAGNKCSVSGDKIKVICKKEGDIVYRVKGKTKKFNIVLNGNEPDPQVGKKEYNMPKMKFKGKYYTNFLDVLYVVKNKPDWNWVKIEWSGKKEVNKVAKYNRNIGYGSRNTQGAYPSWQDIGVYGKKDCIWAALYYDKKSGYVVEKGFVINSWKNLKVEKVVWKAYNTKKTFVKLKCCGID